MIKNINKYAKLTFVFTAIYLLALVLIDSSFFAQLMQNNWIPEYIHNIRPLFYIFNFFPNWIIFYVLYLGSMIVAVVCGVIAFKQTMAIHGKTRWIVSIITLFNILTLILNLGVLLHVW